MTQERVAELREIVITLSPTQHAQLGRDIAILKSALRADSNTAAILEACRRQATEVRLHKNEKRKAP